MKTEVCSSQAAERRPEKRAETETCDRRTKAAFTFRWTDGNDRDFQAFYLKTEEYYDRLAGGAHNRRGFVPYNLSESVTDAVIACEGDRAVGCAGLKPYSDSDAEIKRVWVEPEWRRRHIAREMMARLEKRAAEKGYRRTILQTREVMTDAVGLYLALGYRRIGNYPPYDGLEGAICFAKDLPRGEEG